MPKTVRANLSEQEYTQFSVLAAKRSLSRTQLTQRVIQEWLVSQARVERYCVGREPPSVDTCLEVGSKKVTTRQFARLKSLQALVPECKVDNSTSRMLTYPLSKEIEVNDFLDKCPKGSKREARNPREVTVYKARDLMVPPKTTKKKKERFTKHYQIILEAEKILTEQPLTFDELYPRLKACKRIPEGFNPKPILRRLLKCDLFEFDRESDTYSIKGSHQDPEPIVEIPSLVETIVEPIVEAVSNKPEISSPKVPAFFPRWAGS